MDTTALIGSITTVVSAITFAGIVIWACSRRRRPEFEAAANEPFALPDEADLAARKERRP